jgi:DMSO/TMAO reductase YedYZ molybdopterin-dependent catalytic subunit
MEASMDLHEQDFFEQRRRVLARLGAMGLAAFTMPSFASAAEDKVIQLPFENGERPITSEFPQKSGLILQRTRPPLLETPFDVFDKGVFTPNDRFYVRWHLPDIPTSIDPAQFRLNVHGHVDKPLTLTLDEFARFFQPACGWRTVGQRRDGQRALDGGACQRSAQTCRGAREGGLRAL